MRKEIFCPVCLQALKLGKIDKKIIGMCENEKCESVLVFGDPIQDSFFEDN